MNQVKNNDRIISFDVLRILAAFAVVLLHLASERFLNCFPSEEWEIRNVYDSIVRWAVPVFVMISGALFLNSSKKINIKRFYTKNCFRIIYIFLFWSFCYALYGAILDKSFGIVYFVKATILGPSHFWFLKMLLGLYIAVPILRAITYTKRLEEYFILIAILTAFVIPTFISLIGLFDETAKLDALKYYNEFEIRIASGYVGYFVLGHYLFTYKLNNFLKKLIYLMGLLSVLSVIALTHWYSHYIGESSSGIFYGYLTVFTLFESMAIFLIIKQFNVSENYSSLIIRLSNLSLGVYLIHVLIYRMADDIFGINTISFNPLFFIPCFSLIVFVISCLIVALLKRIPVLKKFVM